MLTHQSKFNSNTKISFVKSTFLSDPEIRQMHLRSLYENENSILVHIYLPFKYEFDKIVNTSAKTNLVLVITASFTIFPTYIFVP